MLINHFRPLISPFSHHFQGVKLVIIRKIGEFSSPKGPKPTKTKNKWDCLVILNLIEHLSMLINHFRPLISPFLPFPGGKIENYQKNRRNPVSQGAQTNKNQK